MVKIATREESRIKAFALAERMGEGWQPHVWGDTRVGWQYRAIRGVAAIHPMTEEGAPYMVFINSSIQVTVTKNDPVEGLQLAIKKLRADLAQIEMDVKELS